jgi:hypothetical protein
MTLNSFHRLLLMGLLVFFVEVSVVLLSAPQTQVLEDAICAKHLERAQQSASPNSVATLRKTCKDEAVQRELSLIKGWQNSFDMVPGFLTALPYASLADRIGRRPVATLSLLGFLTSILWIQFVCWDARVLPLRLTWASSLGLAIGGGGVQLDDLHHGVRGRGRRAEDYRLRRLRLAQLPCRDCGHAGRRRPHEHPPMGPAADCRRHHGGRRRPHGSRVRHTGITL